MLPRLRVTMRLRPPWLLALFLASCVATAPSRPLPAAAQAQEPLPAVTDLAERGKQLNCSAGVRSFEDEGFGSLDDQVAMFLDYCEPMELGLVRLEGGLHYSYDEADGTSGGQDVRLRGRTFEVSAGFNVSKRFGRLRPYAGLGASMLWVDLRGIDEDVDLVFDDDDVTVGGYVKGGLLLQVTRTSHIGLEFRHFEGGDVSMDGTELGTGYDQLAFLFGTSFE